MQSCPHAGWTRQGRWPGIKNEFYYPRKKKKKILIFSVALKFYSSTLRGPLAIFIWDTFTMVKGDDYKMVGEGDDGDVKQDHSRLECWAVAP